MLITGVDIIEIERIRRVTQGYGDRFLRRIYTKSEIEYARGRAPQLASRFAAKEAVAKALGTGIGAELGFHSVQIENDNRGKPLLRFMGSAIEMVAGLNINNAMISLSDEKHYVVAMVVLES